MKPNTKSLASSILILASSLGSANGADSLDLITQLEWENSAELSIPTPSKKWGRPTLLGITGDKSESFQFDKRSTGSDENSNIMADSTSGSDLGLGDLLGSDNSKKKQDTDELFFDNLFDDAPKTKSSTDTLDLGDLLSDEPKTESKELSTDDMDFGNLLSDTPAPQQEKPKASALGMSPKVTKSKTTDMATPTQPSSITPTEFHFKLGNVNVYWQHGYAPSEARVTTIGTFTLEHFLEAIDQPGLLEVFKQQEIQTHLQDSIHLQFTQARLADVLDWISDAYKVPYTLKNRSLHL